MPFGKMQKKLFPFFIRPLPPKPEQNVDNFRLLK